MKTNLFVSCAVRTRCQVHSQKNCTHPRNCTDCAILARGKALSERACLCISAKKTETASFRQIFLCTMFCTSAMLSVSPCDILLQKMSVSWAKCDEKQEVFSAQQESARIYWEVFPATYRSSAHGLLLSAGKQRHVPGAAKSLLVCTSPVQVHTFSTPAHRAGSRWIID